jgi:hypothetical protein
VDDADDVAGRRFRSSELDKIGEPDTVQSLLENKNRMTYRAWCSR